MPEEIKGDTILDLLAEAWNEYLKQYPDEGTKTLNVNDRINFKAIAHNIDERVDFKNIINDAQRLIMAKQLRTIRPDKFNQ